MFQSNMFRTIAAVACTVVFSATTVIAAVGPAQTTPTAAIGRLNA